MHKSEWLSDAQKVPVGQNRRVYHGAETRPNLVVYNNTDSWSAWCHSCQENGFVRKEVLQAVDKSTPVFHKYLSAADCVTLPELARAYPSKFKALVVLLHKKHMSTALIEPYSPVYCLSDDRLVFTFKGASIGRDVTERSHAKWLQYHHVANPMEYVYLQRENTSCVHEPMVLTEDLFSAIKITTYVGVSTLCCLGTRIHDSIIQLIISKAFYPVLAFDGDEAGDKAMRTASKRLRIRDVPFSTVRVPDGLDPKDLDHLELNQLFQGVI